MARRSLDYRQALRADRQEGASNSGQTLGDRQREVGVYALSASSMIKESRHKA